MTRNITFLQFRWRSVMIICMKPPSQHSMKVCRMEGNTVKISCEKLPKMSMKKSAFMKTKAKIGRSEDGGGVYGV